jgi:hypothetical protein
MLPVDRLFGCQANHGFAQKPPRHSVRRYQFMPAGYWRTAGGGSYDEVLCIDMI